MNTIEKLKNAIEDYLSNIRATVSSQQTVTNYSKHLRYFYDFYANKYKGKENECGEDVTASDIKDYRDSLIESGKKSSTIKRYLGDLSYFFSYASDEVFGDERWFTRNPVSKRLYPQTKAEDKRPYDIILSDEQIALLLENKPYDPVVARNWARNYAIVILLLTSEIRNGELLDLKLKDVDLENGEMIIERGKGNKYRVVDLSPIAITALGLYIASGIRPRDCDENDYLFGTTASHEFGAKRNAEPWHRGTTAWLSQLVERHIRSITGVGSVRTHDLRHIGARIDLNAGMRAEALQSKLGHSSITTTQIYSGRLNAKRGRMSAMEILRRMDEQALSNAERLERLVGNGAD